MANKIAIAITGASGSIYAKVLLEKLLQLKDSDVINAEIGNTNFGNEDELIRFFKEYFRKSG